MTVVSGDKSGAIGQLLVVLVLFDELQEKIDFIILDTIFIENITGHSTLKRLKRVLDFNVKTLD